MLPGTPFRVRIEVAANDDATTRDTGDSRRVPPKVDNTAPHEADSSSRLDEENPGTRNIL
jgi:hypothetical protein